MIVTSHSPEDRLSPDITGTSILVAEDYPDNRFVLECLLNNAGAMTQIAVNGQEAFQKALACDFDVILMDLLMPVMDGFESAVKLRNFGYKKPIIALSAFAQSDERDRCLMAGFDDYLSKPIEIDALKTLIVEHVNRAALSHLRTEVADSQALRVFMNDPGVADVVNQIIKRIPMQLNELNACFYRGDLAAITNMVHQLKGLGGMIGLPEITEAAARIENLTRSGTSGLDLKPHLEKLEHACRIACEKVRQSADQS